MPPSTFQGPGPASTCCNLSPHEPLPQEQLLWRLASGLSNSELVKLCMDSNRKHIQTTNELQEARFELQTLRALQPTWTQTWYPRLAPTNIQGPSMLPGDPLTLAIDNRCQVSQAVDVPVMVATQAIPTSFGSPLPGLKVKAVEDCETHPIPSPAPADTAFKRENEAKGILVNAESLQNKNPELRKTQIAAERNY